MNKLELNWCKFTVTSLIALSKRGLPFEELDIPMIPIPSAEIASQCAHALSRIRELRTEFYEDRINELLYAIQYVTGLRELHLESSVDHLLVPHLLLQGQCCAGLESLTIGSGSSITAEQLSELVSRCTRLNTLYSIHVNCISEAVLVELARSCPHLQKVTLGFCAVTEKSVLALAAHCRQLREIDLGRTTVSDETVRQLAQHCRRLTSIGRTYHNQETCGVYYKVWSRMEIRALRELPDTAAP